MSTPVSANTRSNNPTLISGSPLPRRTLMERGNSGEATEETKTDTGDAVDPPPPVNPPPRQAETETETDSDSDEDSIMSSYTETDYLKYLASEYKTFKDNPNLSDVITLERELGTALWNIPNTVQGWRMVPCR